MNAKPFMVRYFKEGDNQKVITSINKKIYFSKDQNISPGYYVGTIIEDREKHGVFDTLPMSELPIKFWVENQVAGVFVKVDKINRKVFVFVSRAPENRQEDEKPIFEKELDKDEAKLLWGDNYENTIMKREGGVKSVHIDGYTTNEELKRMKRKLPEE